MKGLRCSVLRHGDGMDCTLNGVSSKHDNVILVWDDVPGIFKPSEDCPELRLIERNGHLAAYPPDSCFLEGVGKWYMSGGNFIYASDSRFPNEYPIPVHDRYEPKIYD